MRRLFLSTFIDRAGRDSLPVLSPVEYFSCISPMAPNPLSQALHQALPHLGLRDTPLPSVLIHGGALLLWVLLFAMAFAVGGVLAWSVGVAYVVYDTLLLVFVGWHTWRLWNPPRVPAAQTAHIAKQRIVRTNRSAALWVSPATESPLDEPFAPSAPAALALPHSTVCVLIAAYNEAGVLPLTLAALLAQTSPAEQILVVDDGSHDGTAALMMRRYGLPPPLLGQLSAHSVTYPTVRWLRLPHSGKAGALNAALPHVSADVVLTVDGDTLLEITAIAEMRRAFGTEPALAAATGVVVPVCGRSWVGRVFQWFQTYEYIRNFLSRYAWMRMDSLLLLSGAFAGYRRSALVAVGGFDPDSMVEDYELTHRLRRHAVLNALTWTVRVLGNAQARTDAPSTLLAFLRQRRRWFGGFLQTQYRYRDMVGNRRYGRLGRWMLPVKAIDTLQPLYGLTAFFLLVYYLVTGQFRLLGAAAVVIGIKIVIDLAFHCWSIALYQRWIGGTARVNLGAGLLAALAEPFTFQLLRHTGAALGWVGFLMQRNQWGRQERAGVVVQGSGSKSDGVGGISG